MKNSRIIRGIAIALFFGLFLIVLPVQSQDKAKKKEEMENYRDEVKQLISFLQYTLNTLGSMDVSAREKDVIINESYLKIFRDAEVQIEDDLDPSREVVTNKDVQAYLKDVDFFFRDVKFAFVIDKIQDGVNQEGQLFFIVKMNRTMDGIGIEGDTIHSVLPRFVEINVDKEKQDLKIVSIYTTKLSRKEELKAWWNALPAPWKLLFGADVPISDEYYLYDVWEIGDSTLLIRGHEVKDTINLMSYIMKIVDKKELNLSGTRRLYDLSPLNELTHLIKLDLSYTDITDLFPIRSLTTIEVLNCSGTKIEDLSPLKYTSSLRELYIDNTPVNSIRVLENFTNLRVLHLQHTVIDTLPAISSLRSLRELDCSYTNMVSLDSLGELTRLEYLNFSGTMVHDLTPLTALTVLKHLEFNQTQVDDLTPLSGLMQLETISFYSTPVASLMPLVPLANLKRVYCDDSKVDMQAFSEFYKARPDCQVIFSTVQLEDYWEALDPAWRKVIMGSAQIGEEPDKEALHRILTIREIDLSGNEDVNTLEPLHMMIQLHRLNCSHTGVEDLSPLGKQRNLTWLDASNTAVSDISALEGLNKLRVVKCDHTGISDLSPLSGCVNLDSLYFEYTPVSDISVLNDLPHFRAAFFDGSEVTDKAFSVLTYPEDSAVVVYRSEFLADWWGNMADAWQNMFRNRYGLQARPSTVALHRLAGRETLVANSTKLADLLPLPAFVRLKKLEFSDTRIGDLGPLSALTMLKELKCPRNPISDLSPLRGMKTLMLLDVENTQVDDLEPLAGLEGLEVLKCSGTNVKDLDPLAGLSKLRVLEFSKTKVKNIKALNALPGLEVVKCYNNKISPKKIQAFKDSHPDVEVIFY